MFAPNSISRKTRWAALAAVAALPFVPPALASDHNEPAPEAVWPSDAAIDAEWDLSDLYAWYDADTDNLNVILPWHPNQLPLGPGEGAEYSDQVLYAVEFEDSDFFSTNERETISFQYGLNDAGEWGILLEGLPGHERLVFDCRVAEGAVEYHFDAETGSARTEAGAGVFSVGLGVYDDPFVFDIDGYNASLSRALNDEVGLKFDPQNDTFEGLNVTAVVLSIPVSAISEHWEGFDVEDGFKLWATATVTDDYGSPYGGE
ncbi:MAG: hypothetical protein ACRBN8_12610 [Nannocystales bacterium]